MTPDELTTLCESVLEADKQATPGEWVKGDFNRLMEWSDEDDNCLWSLTPSPQQVAGPNYCAPLAGGIFETEDADLIALYRTAAPLLANKVLELMEEVGEGRWYSASTTEAIAAERDQLRKRVEELEAGQ